MKNDQISDLAVHWLHRGCKITETWGTWRGPSPRSPPLLVEIKRAPSWPVLCLEATEDTWMTSREGPCLGSAVILCHFFIFAVAALSRAHC